MLYSGVGITTDYQNFNLKLVTGYHLLIEFWSQMGYRLPLVTKIADPGWLPGTTRYQISRFRRFTIGNQFFD